MNRETGENALSLIRAAIAFIAAALLCSMPAFAEYRTFETESLRILIDSDWAPVGAPGYVPVRFDITNLADAREIEITASQQHFFDPYRRGVRYALGADAGSADIRQLVRLKRGDRVKLTLALPVFADSENFQFRLREGGRPIEGFSSYFTFQSSRPIQETPVLLITTPSSPIGTMATAWLRAVPPSRYFGYTPAVSGVTAGAPRMDFILDPERVPSSWLGFTSLRAVLIGPAEWKILTAPQQDALRTWTASGGDLLLMDSAPDIFFPPGQGPVGPLGSSSVRPYFLGHIHLVNSADIAKKSLGGILDDVDKGVEIPDWALPANRARDWGWIATLGFRLPIEGAGNVPTRAYLSILVVFVALIGPVNYIYLWRKRQQVLLVLTVPLISAAFIILLTGYGLLSQGFDVRARAVTFTVLDQESKHAATRSSVSLYPGGLTPAEGVRFASDVAVFPLGVDGYGNRSRLALDLTGEQRFQSGLLQARTPSNFEQLEYQSARQRLTFERNGEERSVVNGLGSTVQRLFYRDGGAIYALAGPLPAGERAPLKVATLKSLDVFSQPLKGSALSPLKFQQIVDNQSDGSYLAVLQTSPFWDPGVAKLVESNSFHLVLGYAGGQP